MVFIAPKLIGGVAIAGSVIIGGTIWKIYFANEIVENTGHKEREEEHWKKILQKAELSSKIKSFLKLQETPEDLTGKWKELRDKCRQAQAERNTKKSSVPRSKGWIIDNEKLEEIKDICKPLL